MPAGLFILPHSKINKTIADILTQHGASGIFVPDFFSQFRGGILQGLPLMFCQRHHRRGATTISILQGSSALYR